MAVSGWPFRFMLGLLLLLHLGLATSLPSEFGNADLQLAEASGESAVGLRRPSYRSGRRRRPYKQGDPPSWTKEYRGKPSAKCYNEPTVEIVPDGLSSIQHVRDDSVIVLGPFRTTTVGINHSDLSKASSADTKIVARQPHTPAGFDLHTEMSADYFFTCPHLGRRAKSFMWGAGYRTGEPFVHMIHIINVDSFLFTVFDANSGRFYATFEHGWCMPMEQLECRYTAFGHIEGSITQTRISMNLLNSGNDEPHDPQVFEACAPIGTLTVNTLGYPCTMRRVEVRHRDDGP